MTKCLLCGAHIKAPLNLTFLISFKPYWQPVICGTCRKRFKRIVLDHCCKDCSRAGDFKNSICPDCLRWRKLTGERFLNYSLYRYNSMMSEYMHRYKFMGDYRLRYVFQERFSRFVVGMHRSIVPIPLHRETLRQRGFNQVKGLLGSLGITELLRTRRNHKSIPQSRKSRTDRLQMKQPFDLLPNRQGEIKGKAFAVVDDVYTTGTTIRYAARLLTQAGAGSVVGVTLAR